MQNQGEGTMAISVQSFLRCLFIQGQGLTPQDSRELSPLPVLPVSHRNITVRVLRKRSFCFRAERELSP